MVEKLTAAGLEVYAATRSPCHFESANVMHVQAPFETAAQFQCLVQNCSDIIHAASISTPSASAAQPQIEGNLRTTLALLEALQVMPSKRLIYLSSGGTLYGDCKVPPCESAPLRPRSYHGAGKAAAEQFVHAWAAQYNGSAVVLRPSNVFGPGQFAKAGFAVVPHAMSAAIRGTALPVWGDGRSARDYLYIDDLMDLVQRLLATEAAAEVRTYNVSAGRSVSLNALLDMIERATGHPVRRDYQPQRRVDVSNIVPDSCAAQKDLGWRPQTDLEPALRKTWEWFKANQGAAPR